VSEAAGGLSFFFKLVTPQTTPPIKAAAPTPPTTPKMTAFFWALSESFFA
jgi:hypothetical protein